MFQTQISKCTKKKSLKIKAFVIRGGRSWRLSIGGDLDSCCLSRCLTLSLETHDVRAYNVKWLDSFGLGQEYSAKYTDALMKVGSCLDEFHDLDVAAEQAGVVLRAHLACQRTCEDAPTFIR